MLVQSLLAYKIYVQWLKKFKLVVQTYPLLLGPLQLVLKLNVREHQGKLGQVSLVHLRRDMAWCCSFYLKIYHNFSIFLFSCSHLLTKFYTEMFLKIACSTALYPIQPPSLFPSPPAHWGEGGEPSPLKTKTRLVMSFTMLLLFTPMV